MTAAGILLLLASLVSLSAIAAAVTAVRIVNGARRDANIALAQFVRSLTSDEHAFIAAFHHMQTVAHDNSRSKGWWDGDEHNDAEKVALMHSELSEALEGLRHGNPPSDKIPQFSSVEEEYADTVIRIMDHAGARGWRVALAIVAKMAYNSTRTYKHGGKSF